jgi:hypothetical protein
MPAPADELVEGSFSSKLGIAAAVGSLPSLRTTIASTFSARSKTAIWSPCIRTCDQKPGDNGAAVVHTFRFEGDRIAELWDIGQPVPADSVNDNGMF